MANGEKNWETYLVTDFVAQNRANLWSLQKTGWQFIFLFTTSFGLRNTGSI